MKRNEEILANFEESLVGIHDPKMAVEAILDFVLLYGDSYGPQLTPLLERSMAISREIGFSAGEVLSHYHIVFFQDMTQGPAHGSGERANMPNLEELAQRVKGDPHWYSLTLNLLAFYHWFRGDYEKGFNTAFDALRVVADRDDKNIAWHHFALGVFYFDTKDLTNSDLYYQQAYDTFNRYDYAYGSARAANGLASVAILRNDSERALPLLEYATKVYRELGHYSGLSRAINDTAMLEKKKNNFNRAIDLFRETIELRTEIGHTQGLITSLTELGEIYLEQDRYEEALAMLERGLVLSEKIGSKQKSMRLSKLLYDIHKKLGKTDLALKYFETYYDLKTQLMGDEASNSIKRLQTNFEKEKSEQQAEIERLKHVELKKAYEIIEQKNKDIHDSINYASRIQRSLLPSDRNIQKMLENLRKN